MSVDVDPGSRAFVLACSAMAAANLSAWLAGLAGYGNAIAAIAALLAAVVAGMLSWQLFRRRFDSGMLAWDGATWHWRADAAMAAEAAAVVGDARILIDLGHWMLVRFEPAGSPRSSARWLPMSKRQAGHGWPHWRAALFARRGPAHGPAKGEPS